MTDYELKRLAALIREARDGRHMAGRRVGIAGTFYGRIIDPTRCKKNRVIEDWYAVPNAAVTVGLNYVLDTSFRGGSALSSWYIGLITNSAFSGLASTDTMSSHAGWAEYTGYTEGTRRQWSPGAASGGSLVNSSAVQFTNGGSTGSIKGMFLGSDNTKSGTSGTLWATAIESSARSLAASQVFQVYYELDMTPTS